jgi:xylulokinase
MHHSKKHFIRAILEGVSFSLKDCLNLLSDIFSINYSIKKDKNIINQNIFNEAILLGGGSKSKIWSQILADILGINLLKIADVDASFGSALIGSIGIKLFNTPADAVKKCSKITEKFYPEKNNFLFYQKLFPIYNRIHNSLENIYKEISFLK